MSIKYLNDAWDMPGLNSAEKIVLLAIADCANNEGFAYPGYSTLTQKTGMARTTLSKCLKILKGAEILKVDSHAEIGAGKTVNTYTISMRVQLPISSDRELIEQIKELRKESARPKSSTLITRKVAPSSSKSSTLQHEPSYEPPVKQPPVLKTVKFTIPTLQEVSDHISEKKYNIDPEQFIAHYTSNGWMVGKNKMKCWKSAMVTWTKRSSNKGIIYDTNRTNNETNAATGRKLSLVEQGQLSIDRIEARERRESQEQDMVVN
ncbi:MAG: helix-turn-helix domain-containing protein [Methylococcaceae bacterium]|jgi:hypothetical protein